MTTTNFIYTGSVQTYTVPAGVSVLLVDMCGGAAERMTGLDSLGYATRVQFRLAVTPGDVLTIYPGNNARLTPAGGAVNGIGAAGYSGGGGGGGPTTGSYPSAGGGGSSALLKTGTLIAEAGGGSSMPFTVAGGGPQNSQGVGGGGGYFGLAGQAGDLGGGYGGQNGGGGGGSQGGNGGAGGTGGAGGAGVNGATNAGGVGSSTGPTYAGGTAYYVGGTTAHFTPQQQGGASWVAATSTTGVAFTDSFGTGYVSITNEGPLLATLLDPANGTFKPPGEPFSWSYAASLSGNSMTGYILRYKTTGASAYSYFSGTWSSPSSTPVVISATAPGVTPTAATFPIGSRYQWSVANVDQGGQSTFATDAVWTSAAAPAVTITAPTGGTFNGSGPTVTWTAVPASPAALVSTQCQVYAPDKWAACGGVPFAGFPTTADSGVTNGSLSFAVPAILQNGVAYWFAVQAIDNNGETTTVIVTATCTFDGPSNPRLWAIPTTDAFGTPCNQLTVASIDNLLSAVDSSFEGPSIGSWTATAATLSTSTTAIDGFSSLRVNCSGGQATLYSSGLNGARVAPGRLYCASLFIRAVATPRSVSIGINWYNSSGTVISGATGSFVTESAAGTWKQIVINAVSPTGAAFAGVYLVINGAVASEVHLVDQVSLVPGADIGAFTMPGGLTHVIAANPVFTSSDVGSYFSGSTGSAVQINAYVSPNEVILTNVLPGGAHGYIGPYVGGSTTGLPKWTIGGLAVQSIGIQATDAVTGDSRWVRNVSAAHSVSVVSPGSPMVFYDYESAPQHLTKYTAFEFASNAGAAVSASSATSVAVTLVTDRLWIFDPLKVAAGINVVDVTQQSGAFSRSQYVTPHKQVGNPFVALISDTVGGMDGAITVRVQGAARWFALIGGSLPTDGGLVATQAPVCISDPLGGLYYGRLGVAPGGTGGGSAIAVAAGSYVQANIANQVRDVGLNFIAQPAPAT